MPDEDKLIRIFKPLKFEEQLSLACESDRLRNVFENHIWKVNYRTLNICKVEGGGFDVSNETHLNRVFLTDEEALRHFMEFYAENVKILISYGFNNIQLFKNLTSLRYCCNGEEVSECIPIVANSLEHLESLELWGFRVKDSFEKLESVNSLLQMRKLKRLRVDSYVGTKIKYQNFRKLAAKLEVLKFSGVLEHDENCDNSETEQVTRTHSDQLKELEICTTFDPKNWSHKYLTFLATFKSLTTLSIRITNGIDDYVWTIFVTYCQEVEKLTISQGNFKNITFFFVPPKLSELKLEECKGLTYNNLKQILQEAKLIEFQSFRTSYEGEFKDFRIASTIRTLNVDTIDMCAFRSAYDSNENLKSLKWNRTHKTCTNTKSMKSLALCKNLETLYLEPLTQATLDALLHLNHLRELTTRIDASTQWSCFIALLKHSSVCDLSVYIDGNVRAAPTEGFPTNISTLKIHYRLEVDEFALDFLVDLFCQNPNLKVSIWTQSLEKSLKSLINHDKFPRNLETVIVWGFTLNCDDLRKNFVDTFKIFECSLSFWVDPGIVLCRE